MRYVDTLYDVGVAESTVMYVAVPSSLIMQCVKYDVTHRNW
jgi:hypothetical protein